MRSLLGSLLETVKALAPAVPLDRLKAHSHQETARSHGAAVVIMVIGLHADFGAINVSDPPCYFSAAFMHRFRF